MYKEDTEQPKSLSQSVVREIYDPLNDQIKGARGQTAVRLEPVLRWAIKACSTFK